MPTRSSSSTVWLSRPPERTAFDLGRHLPRDAAVSAPRRACPCDGSCKRNDVLPLIDRYPAPAECADLEEALDLMDADAESPKETWYALDADRRRVSHGQAPRFQCRMTTGTIASPRHGLGGPDGGVEYDGDQHRTDREAIRQGHRATESCHRRGWVVVRVIAGHHPAFILHRVRQAWAQREPEVMAASA